MRTLHLEPELLVEGDTGRVSKYENAAGSLPCSYRRRWRRAVRIGESLERRIQMNNGLNALLDSAFRDANKIRNAVEQFREQARKHPQQVAALIVEEIPEQRKRTRGEIAASFGVDLSDAEELKAAIPLSRWKW